MSLQQINLNLLILYIYFLHPKVPLSFFFLIILFIKNVRFLRFVAYVFLSLYYYFTSLHIPLMSCHPPFMHILLLSNYFLQLTIFPHFHELSLKKHIRYSFFNSLGKTQCFSPGYIKLIQTFLCYNNLIDYRL